jgi:hypothetical protein
MDFADLENRFAYHAPNDEATKEAHAAATLINGLVPGGREKSLAITSLEETMMWANAGIARH